jgi:uncharacterized protein (TIGR02246 family)
MVHSTHKNVPVAGAGAAKIGAPWVLALLAALSAVPAGAIASQASDERAIRQIFADFNAALNRHDAQAMASMCTEDADYLVIPGNDLVGRVAIEQYLRPLFNGILKSLTREASVQKIRFLRPDVAVLIGDYRTSGVVTANGPAPPSKGLYDWVLTKQDGRWLISLWREADPPTRPARAPNTRS